MRCRGPREPRPSDPSDKDANGLCRILICPELVLEKRDSVWVSRLGETADSDEARLKELDEEDLEKLCSNPSLEKTLLFNMGIQHDFKTFDEFAKSHRFANVEPLDLLENAASGDSESSQFKHFIDAVHELCGSHLKWQGGGGRVSRNLVLYYSGHGLRGSGNWYMRDLSTARGDRSPDLETFMTKTQGIIPRSDAAIVTLDYIFHKWTRSTNCRVHSLVIVSDCCFSGHWCHRLRELVSEGNDIRIAVQAACLPDETACTRALVNFLAKSKPPKRQTPCYFRSHSDIDFPFVGTNLLDEITADEDATAAVSSS